MKQYDPMRLAQLFVTLLCPPDEVKTLDEYRNYIKTETLAYGQGGATKQATPTNGVRSAGRPPDPVRQLLKTMEKSPEKYIIYEGDYKDLEPFKVNNNQDGMEEDELRLHNNMVLVFPGKVSGEPGGILTVKEE